jgi:hypothetical protein
MRYIHIVSRCLRVEFDSESPENPGKRQEIIKSHHDALHRVRYLYAYGSIHTSTLTEIKRARGSLLLESCRIVIDSGIVAVVAGKQIIKFR